MHQFRSRRVYYAFLYDVMHFVVSETEENSECTAVAGRIVCGSSTYCCCVVGPVHVSFVSTRGHVLY